jgi:hypothetical protein
MGTGGVGKSTVAAKFIDDSSKLLSGAYRIGGIHFCRHDNVADSRPRRIVTSLAMQLYHLFLSSCREYVPTTTVLPDDLTELFEFLLRRPLGSLAETPPDYNIILVVDALDELPSDSKNQVLNLMALNFITLPSFVRILGY